MAATDRVRDVPVVDMVRSPARRFGRYGLLVGVTVVVLLPIYVTLIGALKPGEELLDYPRSLLPVDRWHRGLP